MIHGKNFFYQAIKNDKITYENIRKIATGQGDNYTFDCLLDNTYFRDVYKCYDWWKKLFLPSNKKW